LLLLLLLLAPSSLSKLSLGLVCVVVVVAKNGEPKGGQGFLAREKTSPTHTRADKKTTNEKIKNKSSVATATRSSSNHLPRSISGQRAVAHRRQQRTRSRTIIIIIIIML
jgi:hypothetical protein